MPDWLASLIALAAGAAAGTFIARRTKPSASPPDVERRKVIGGTLGAAGAFLCFWLQIAIGGLFYFLSGPPSSTGALVLTLLLAAALCGIAVIEERRKK